MTPPAVAFLINQDVSAQVRCSVSVLITASPVSTKTKGIWASSQRCAASIPCTDDAGGAALEEPALNGKKQPAIRRMRLQRPLRLHHRYLTNHNAEHNNEESR